MPRTKKSELENSPKKKAASKTASKTSQNKTPANKPAEKKSVTKTESPKGSTKKTTSKTSARTSKTSVSAAGFVPVTMRPEFAAYGKLEYSSDVVQMEGDFEVQLMLLPEFR